MRVHATAESEVIAIRWQVVPVNEINIVYQAAVETSNIIETYVGLTQNQFKKELL